MGRLCGVLVHCAVFHVIAYVSAGEYNTVERSYATEYKSTEASLMDLFITTGGFSTWLNTFGWNTVSL
jgi:hypothetical protein